MIEVFKFGGASVNSVERIENLEKLLQQFGNKKLLIIISAMGKTTNALEAVAHQFYNNNAPNALALFATIKEQHLQLATQILTSNLQSCINDLNCFFTEIEWLLHDNAVREYDYYYDQIVCVGELLSTSIISHFLNERAITNKWVDVRDVIRTDNNFRDAAVDIAFTSTKANALQRYFNAQNNIIVTQGFIGCTHENESTTLGREGSDYTAALLANMLDANKLTIWKDVAGVMNADPKEFNDAVLINELSYEEVIEMSFYGAQVIHPKTIKPLQNKNITLFVKCFLDSTLEGTKIDKLLSKKLPPIYVIKKNQVLIKLDTQDFSFIGEEPIRNIYTLFETLKIKPNLIQTGAISVLICMDENAIKVDQFASMASKSFNVSVTPHLMLSTIRHYKEEEIASYFANKNIILQQKTQQTIQCLYSN
jgi:aspartate kinase